MRQSRANSKNQPKLGNTPLGEPLAMTAGNTVVPRCGSGLAVPPAWWVGRSLASRPRVVTPGERPDDSSTREDRPRARLGDQQGSQFQLLAQAGRRSSVHPQTCDWRCRACCAYGRPFYSHGDLRYLEHGTGPLAAELDRLWHAKGMMKGRTAREGASAEGGGWWALPQGAAGLMPRRPHLCTVTDLYYRGLQNPPTRAWRPQPGRWAIADVSVAASPTCLARLRRASEGMPERAPVTGGMSTVERRRR